MSIRIDIVPISYSWGRLKYICIAVLLTARATIRKKIEDRVE